MSVRGPLCHIDLSVSDPARSIPFYDRLLVSLGYARSAGLDAPDRARWSITPRDGARFEIEVRPAAPNTAGHDRYAPGLHHLAFHAEDRAAVDAIHAEMQTSGATVLDPPADYGDGGAYPHGYYAVFFADPDGIKLEVVFDPTSQPEGNPP